MADAETRLYGVIGFPARHSLSPVMHNAAFRALGINAVYLAFEVPRRSLGRLLGAPKPSEYPD